MEMETDEGINSLKARIETQHKSHMYMLSSVQSVIPNFVSSLDLSLKVLSSFNHRPFAPTPPLTNFNPPKSSSLQQLPQKPSVKTLKTSLVVTTNPVLEKVTPLSVVLSMVAVCLLSRLPFMEIDSSTLWRKLENDETFTPQDKAAFQELAGDSGGPTLAVEIALRSMADDNGAVELEEFAVSGKSRIMVLNIDRTRLLRQLPETAQHQLQQQQDELSLGDGNMNQNQQQIAKCSMNLEDVDALINKKSFREMQKYETAKELLKIIQTPSIREAAVAAKFKTKGGSQMRPYCDLPTKEDCRRRTGSFIACNKLHFRRIIALHTDINLGDCPFLRTCRHMNTCKYVHYEEDPTPDLPPTMMCAPPPPLKPLKQQRAEYCSEAELGQPQWINCDIRNFRMDILGKFGVIMADPPWDIHMELPYGTMADDEMRTLNVPALQTHGLIFLWVTGRAMELGRECLERWGYKCVEEIIWVKTNQLQRIIRTGRTGHWLNHSKEHCLVGIKGSPEVNRNIDTNVIVSEVRETSRKPDEMYAMMERISPGTRKVELFARMHNTHAGWMSLGNQLSGVRLVDEGLRARFKAAYPDVEVQPASPSRASAMELDSSVAAQTTTSAMM
ncbi:putative N6-adenosine-methyltransferase MT-A70-like protein [Medicago truncatula]|uniref:Putative N(6)-adenosine-methyltransferase MT-A70-like n=2 Tax=Medicago truncatula TaxID=3880 RepID=MTA70_MEDTR|nr:putative N6-adenosine-methyltransferase MT-A70-like [Medicago truncatula]Q2HVD6.1 RecName: Full=Putative N6-adenosine-methyltransferase MT-A70-like [Medicago truncatula]ABD28511.1 MT-A70 [Medicago truncatula]AES67837.1 N6-adenosine-methyltransferase MT-A70-like protein [Medicago truncatula]RHN76260.1 putative N6-adenosine-methyltransferase MT-A70-like protein [Medicago truncatula]